MLNESQGSESSQQEKGNNFESVESFPNSIQSNYKSSESSPSDNSFQTTNPTMTILRKKTNRKRGRKKANDNERTDDKNRKKGKRKEHSKKEKGNIITNHSNLLFNHIYDFVNAKLKEKGKTLEKVKNGYNGNKEKLKAFINSTIRGLFTQINSKSDSDLQKYKKMKNETIINEVVQKEPDLNEIFDTTVSKMSKIYYEEKNGDIFENFKRFEDDKLEMIENNGQDYINCYTNHTEDFEATINNIGSKKNRTKKMEIQIADSFQIK